MSCAVVVIAARRPATPWSGRWRWTPQWSAPISTPPAPATRRRRTWSRRTRPIRAQLRRRRIKTTIPERTDQQANRARLGNKGGRPPTFDPETYQGRNVIERCINKLTQFRTVATRYDKPAYIFHGTVDVASIRIWLRDPVP
jgi:transposase